MVKWDKEKIVEISQIYYSLTIEMSLIRAENPRFLNHLCP